MNKTERLYALVEELRAVAPRVRSARWLAEHFEVSVRTIERDLGALQQAGVPIWAAHGRRGGYALDATTSLPPLNFTPSEAAAIAVAVGAAGPAPFGTAGRSGLGKIISAMSPAGRRDTAALMRRIRVPDRGGEVPTGPVPNAVSGALAGSRVIEIDYVDKLGVVSSRLVEPIGFVGLGRHWYLVAWCRLRADHRAFRLDRITAASVTFERTPQRDLPEPDCEFAVHLRRLALED